MGDFSDVDSLIHWAGSLKAIFVATSISSARLFAAFAILPFTGESFLQGTTRNGVVIMMAVFMAFGVPASGIANLAPLALAGIVLKEAMVGLLLGFCASTVFWVAECVGALIDTQAGYNNVQLTNPLSGQQSTPVSDLLLQLVIAVFYTMGGMLVFMGALFESYKVWPLLAPMPSITGAAEVFFYRQVDGFMTSVVKFAAPALLVLVLIDVGFGLITRAADKLQPSSLSQPVKGAVTMLLLAFMAGVFVTQVRFALLPTDLIAKLHSLIGTR
jgi:type III secretion protein T